MAKQKKTPVIGFTPEQAAAWAKAQEESSKGTPKIVLDAFLPERIASGGVVLAPVNLDHIMALQKAAPGILRESDPAAFDLREVLRGLFILTQDQDLTERLLAYRLLDDVTGAVVFPEFERAVSRLGRGIQANQLLALAPAIEAALQAAMAPAVPYGVDKKTDPDSPFPPARTQGPGSDGC